MDNYGYKLIGTLDLFDNDYPCFVYCVFENNGRYYLAQNDYDTKEIKAFNRLTSKTFPKTILLKINPLLVNTSTFNIKDQYYPGDDCILAFKQSKYKTVVGEHDDMARFFKKYLTFDTINDAYLLKEINSIIKTFESSKKVKTKTLTN